MRKRGKPEEYKRGGRRIQGGIWERRKKDGRRTQRNARKIHDKNAI